jgi:regulator of ribonuclease activity A
MMESRTTDLADQYGSAAQHCIVQFRHFGRRRYFAGKIETIRTREDAGLIIECRKGPAFARVLVVDREGSLCFALFGDKLSNLAVENSWNGLVVDGAIRDTAAINDLPIGIHALGTIPARGSKSGAGELKVPVSFGNVTFMSGHFIYCDDDGIIVLPQDTESPYLWRSNTGIPFRRNFHH